MDAQQRIAELEAKVAEQALQIAALLEKVAQLTEQLAQTSRNSHRPPSSDPPGSRSGSGEGTKRRKGSKRKRGGQKGHRGNRRELLPESQVDDFVHFYPEACESCWEPLSKVADPKATRFQVTETPPIVPHTTEYRCHTVQCRCGYRTKADGSAVPASPFGPRLMSVVALLTGVYHLSRRRTVSLLRDLLGVRISLGAVSAIEARASEAVVPAVDQAWASVGNAPVKHTDGTSWLQAGAALSLWTIATAMVTVFKVVSDSSKRTLQPLFGALHGILVSDRAMALNFWAMDRRQICWSHLLRKFISFSERDGPAARFGREFLDYTGLVFEYYHDVREGRLSRAQFVAWLVPVRAGFEDMLERAAAAGVPRMSGSCKDILAHRQALWTFVDHSEVEPTNNHAERELRAFVLWRKRSFGTQSERGNRFAERLMTVAHTARKQNRDVLNFLTDCCQAAADGTEPPLLLPPAIAAGQPAAA